MGGYDGNSRLPGFVDVTMHGEVLGKHPLSYRGSDAEIDSSGVHQHKRTDGLMIRKRSPLVRPCAGAVAELMTLDFDRCSERAEQQALQDVYVRTARTASPAHNEIVDGGDDKRNGHVRA